MSGIRFQLVVDGELQVDRGLSRMLSSLKDFRPFFEGAEGTIAHAVEAQFTTQGRRTGGWKALSPRYARWKSSRFGHRPIMQLSGNLRSSFKRIRISAHEMAWGTRDPKAMFHQRGTRRMPQRRLIDLTEGDRRAMMKALQVAMAAGMHRK